ncbi:MAG TPA: DMT family transporter [Thermoanaerobaculia bacterium]|nr:DMT family transporter [Thermoanaerobaculia bacterium]
MREQDLAVASTACAAEVDAPRAERIVAITTSRRASLVRGDRTVAATTLLPAPGARAVAAFRPETRLRAADMLLLFTPGTIWGASFLFIAEGLTAVGPFGVAFLRIAVGCCTLLLLPAARRPLPPSAWPAVARLGVVWFALPLSLLPLAEQRVSSALTGMLNGAVPIFAAAAGALLTRKLPSRRMAGGLGVGLAGALLVALPTVREGRSSAAGVLLVLGSIVAYGFAVHLAKPLQQRHGALPIICRALGVAALLTAPLGLRDVAHARWSPAPLLCLVALGALGTGVAFVILATAAGRLGATRASATAFVIPGVALALGVLVRGETVASLAVLGALLSLAGVALLRRAQDP